MDIKPPPKRRIPPVELPPIAAASPVDVNVSQSPNQNNKSRRRTVTFLLVGAGLLLLGATISTTIWYEWATAPRSSESKQVRVIVKQGSTAATIGKTLKEHDLIRSTLAFTLYTQLHGERARLQAGGYVLSPNQSVESIVDHMVGGRADEFNVTIPPGLTLREIHNNFMEYGYETQEIDDAFSAGYDHPLLSTKPADATLEGYIYPETYRVSAQQPLSDLLERSFDELYKILKDKKYLDEYTKRNLTIHQALTLASIVEEEVPEPTDQKQVAQVFYKRLSSGIQLGSDATFMYAAKQLGVRGTPSLDSPYNTRKYTGLPPGPISNMNPSALEAVAFPAPGDYLYFVSGDNGVNYFSKTQAEHDANVKAHCTTLCQ